MVRAADGEHAEGRNVFDVRWLCVMFSVMGPGMCQVGGAGMCRVGGTMCVTSTVI